MKQIFFTPGPSQLYPTLEKHIATALHDSIASISHRSNQFEDIFASTTNGLRKLLHIPLTHNIFFVASGTEAMERIIENCVEKYSFHFVNGSFSQRFYDIAKELGKSPNKIEAPLGQGFDLLCHSERSEESSKKILRDAQDDKLKQSELICITHNETSTGVMIPDHMIHTLAKTYPNKLIAVDIVSSAPYPTLNYSLLDIVFFSVQKGFGLPAGLGVMIVSPRVIAKAEALQKKGMHIGSYHSFPMLKTWADKMQTPETPPVLHIYLLGKVLEDMCSVGIQQIRKQTEEKAYSIYDFLDSNSAFSAGVQDKRFRSPTVIVINVGNKQKQLREYLTTKGIIVGSGYGPKKHEQIRITNFFVHTKKHIQQLLSSMQSYKSYLIEEVK